MLAEKAGSWTFILSFLGVLVRGIRGAVR